MGKFIQTSDYNTQTRNEIQNNRLGFILCTSVRQHHLRSKFYVRFIGRFIGCPQRSIHKGLSDLSLVRYHITSMPIKAASFKALNRTIFAKMR